MALKLEWHCECPIPGGSLWHGKTNLRHSSRVRPSLYIMTCSCLIVSVSAYSRQYDASCTMYNESAIDTIHVSLPATNAMLM